MHNVKVNIFIALIIFAVSSPGTSQEILKSGDYPITPVPFSKVRITDNFFSKKIRINHDVTIPIAIHQSEETGRIDNFRRAAGIEEGAFCSIYPFDDSDVYKIIEAASYSIQTFPDNKMETTIDSLIELIAEAQEPDGYLYTNRTIGVRVGDVHPWAGDNRWQLVNELSHELYNVGHMYEAAAAHYIATGKRSLLDVAIKNADLVCSTFGPGKLENYPGHQEIEIGLVKLYRITGKSEYLETAKFFLDARGREGIGRPDRYNQSHIPVIDQTEAVGHSVRAAYMWTAMADVAAITGNQDYMKAINALWHDVVDSKYYINGGIGSTSSHEGFGPPFDLPNMSAYNETCAGVGNAMWNHRMFLMTGDAKFIDILERTMYNNILTGVSYSGDHFFYPNPLASRGQHERSAWFGCACCPPNVARFLPSMPGYIYANKGNDIYVNLFVSSESSFELDGGILKLSQESNMPWEGKIDFKVSVVTPVKANIKIRIPGWAKNKPVPGELYHYKDKWEQKPIIKLNGVVQVVDMDDFGYVSLDKLWNLDDEIEIEFPFSVRKVIAREEVREDNFKIAIERGPILYCAEWVDNGSVLNIVMDENSTIEESFDPDLFGGVYTLSTTSRKANRNASNEVYLTDEEPVKLIPYFLWNNRGPGEMRVWLPVTKSSTKPTPAPTIAYRSKLTSSEGSRTLFSIVDQEEPSSSGDRENSFFHWWPKKDSWEWIQFDFEKPAKISEVDIYWFDDIQEGGGTKIPDDWEVEYRKADKWMTVSTVSKTPVEIDKWNKQTFSECKAEALRIKVKLNNDFSAGVHEIVIK